MLPAWFIGCSGYHYRHWKGAFYPEKLPQRRWSEFYSQHFSTLELNSQAGQVRVGRSRSGYRMENAKRVCPREQTRFKW